MNRLVPGLAALLILAALPAVAAADDRQDCKQKSDPDRRIAACTRLIDTGRDSNQNRVLSHIFRGNAYAANGEHDRAVADYTEAIRLDPKSARAYYNRGNAYSAKGEHDRAIADYTEAIRLYPKYAGTHNNRGNAYRAKGQHDRAISDYTEAIRLAPKSPIAYNNRGHTYEKKRDRDSAIADYRQILDLPAPTASDRQRQEVARERIARLTQAQPASAPSPRRVALVIGNSNYAHAGLLTNPKNDAEAVTAVLRRLGFAEVFEHYDLSREAMGQALKHFGDRAEGAEWAVVFFAGHGLEMNGTSYLIPTDAALKRDTHVSDETLSLDRVQAKVDAASKLGLVILDACRNNPFLARMVRTGGAARAIGRGLANVEPEGNVLVAYAAKHGTFAEDGSGKNSPFTEALLAHIEEPGLEINFLFRKVRDEVRKKTQRRQEPFLYGSLGSEPLYFKTAAAR